MKEIPVPKVVILGLDGGDWNILNNFFTNDKLVNLKKLIDNSSTGSLESTLPPVTGPAWTSILTGTNPGKHGIFDFVKIANNQKVNVKSTGVKGKRLYDYLSENNISSTVLSVPLTYPPDDTFKGVMVSDFLYPKYEIYPTNKSEYIKDLAIFPNLDEEKVADNLIETGQNRISLAKKIIIDENWELFFLWFGELDWALHRFYREFDSGTDNHVIEKILQIFDEFLEWIEENVDYDFLFIVSDHGFTGCEKVVYLNVLFNELGYIQSENKTRNDVNTTYLKKLSGQRGLKIGLPTKYLTYALNNRLLRTLKNFVDKLLKIDIVVKSTRKIDYMKSDYYVTTWESMGVFVNPRNYNERRSLMKNILLDLRLNDEPVFKEVLFKEQVYDGPYTSEAPDLVLIPNGFLPSPAFNTKKVVFDRYDPGGYHDPQGIFIAHGSGVRKGFEVDGVRVVDVLPTILELYGLDYDDNVDGEAVKSIFL